MDTVNDILAFIRRFRDAQTVFLNGCCYWFARILAERFGAEICYDNVSNHFVGKIGDAYYDVTGEVHGTYVPWSTYEAFDSLDYGRVVRDCIRMEDFHGE